MSHKFIIRTDQQALKHLCYQTIQTPEQQRWFPKLLGYTFNIKYKPGKDNVIANALCRSFKVAFSISQRQIMNKIQQLQLTNPLCASIIHAIQNNYQQDTKYFWRNNLLWWNGKVVVSGDDHLKVTLMQEFHSTLIEGHVGCLRTYARIAHQFYWKGMQTQTAEFIKSYLVCQQAKHDNTHPGGLLQSLPIPQHIWKDITTNFIVGLPLSKALLSYLRWLIVSPNLTILFL